MPNAGRYTNGVVKKESSGIVNGFNSWVGSNGTIIANVNNTYFAALVTVSQYNNIAAMFIVSVGNASTGLRATEITNTNRGITFTYENGHLCINGAIDCNVVVMELYNRQ